MDRLHAVGLKFALRKLCTIYNFARNNLHESFHLLQTLPYSLPDERFIWSFIDIKLKRTIKQFSD